MDKEKPKILDNQVSGKLPKFTDQTGQFIYKKLSQQQLSFYLQMKQTNISSMDSNLQQFIPQFVGVQSIELTSESCEANQSSKKEISNWLEFISARKDIIGNQFIILRNLTQGYEQTCIMDVKLGRKLIKKASNKKFETSTTNSHHFRINGMKTYQSITNNHSFINKYYFQKTTQSQIESHLAYFFYDGSEIDVDLITKCVQIVKKIVFSLLSFKGGIFHSSSLLICYDGKNHSSFQVKLIDFDKYKNDDKNQPDHNIIEGLKYIVGYLSDIVRNPRVHQKLINQNQLKFLANNSLNCELKNQDISKEKRTTSD